MTCPYGTKEYNRGRLIAAPTCGIWSQALLRELENECGRFDSALPHQWAETRSGRLSGLTPPETAAPALHARPYQRSGA